MARIKATEAFKATAVEMQRGYYVKCRNGCTYVLIENHDGVNRNAVIRCANGTPGGYLYNGWPVDNVEKYSTDCGQTWRPFVGDPRGIKSGDVLVERSTGMVVAYCVRESLCEPIYDGLLRNELRVSDLDILDGPDADAVLPRIIRGEKVNADIANNAQRGEELDLDAVCKQGWEKWCFSGRNGNSWMAIADAIRPHIAGMFRIGQRVTGDCPAAEGGAK